VLVLVLEKWGWGGGVLEYCACCELRVRGGLKVPMSPIEPVAP
jgi:hypothetical protein